MLKKATNLLAATAILLLSTESAARAQCTGCAKPSFEPALPWTGPIGSVSDFAAADFDQDDILDVAVPRGSGAAIFFGDGRGTFGPSATVPGGNTYYFVASGDFDGNGFPDLVLSNYGSFEVFLADGLGAFTPSASGVSERGRVFAADFDGDGHVDLMTGADLFPGQGDGTFGAPNPLPGGPYVYLLALGDFDGDGLADAAVSAFDDMQTLLSDGSGGFTLGGSFSAPPHPIRYGAAADLDGDGDADLALKLDGDFGSDPSVQVLLGDGQGQFSVGVSLPIEQSFSSIVAADFDGGGLADLLLGGGAFYSGTGGGQFAPPIAYDFAAWSLVAGDFNRDGLTDVAAAMQGVVVLLGNAGGGLDVPTAVPYSTSAGGAAIADVTGDGIPDLVASIADFVDPSVSVFPGTAAGLGPQEKYSLASAVSSIAVGDFKEDGVEDLAAGTGGQIALYLWDGAAGFLPPTFLETGTGASGIAAGLFDADAHEDLVSVGNGLELFAGDGAGGFAAPTHVSDVLGNTALTADFNGDGEADVAVLAGAIHVFLGHGDGAFDDEVMTPMPGFSDSYAIADFDEDGHLDLALGGLFDIPVLLGDGAGGFAAPEMVHVTDASSFLSVAAGDFNGDGHADLAVAAREDGLFIVVAGEGDGQFGAASPWYSSAYPLRIALGDLDLDGKTDAATVGRTIGILRNSNCEVRRIGVPTDVSTCAAPGQPFPGQPSVAVYDDGGNVITCNTDLVSASIVSGTGTPGALLAGDTEVEAAAGVAAYTDLAIGPVGVGYVLAFSHPVAGTTRSRAVTVGDPPAPPDATNSGPFCQGQDLNLFATTVPGAVYRWTGPNGFFSTAQSPTIPNATADAAGAYSVIALVDGCEASAAITTVEMQPPAPGPTILGQSQVCFGSRLLLRVDDGGFGHTWYRNGMPIEGATGPIFTVDESGFGEAGTYTVTSSDATGCTTALSAEFAVAIAFCHAEAQALAADPAGNGILDPGETGIIDPTWRNRDIVTLSLLGTLGTFSGPAGPSYVIDDGTANYGSLPPDAAADCLAATGDCYAVTVTPSGPRPATHWDAFLDETPGVDPARTWVIHIGGSFTDVPVDHPFYPGVETALHNGITAGCSPTTYCLGSGVTRAQMAVFLLKAKYGSEYDPGPAQGTVFDDVPADAFAAAWIERLYYQGITSGCGNGNYCPDQVVTRAQMAVFLLKAAGTGVAPCTGLFADVACPGGFAVDHIEQLYNNGTTGGCGIAPLLYCPGNPNTRGQMAVFLMRTFGLSAYAP